MVLGALDPLEGSVVILAGSLLLLAGSFAAGDDRPARGFHALVFLLVAFGVGALWAISSVGGVGGPHGHSNWWLLFMAPYPVGWCLGMCGSRTPRWQAALGIFVGAFYLFLMAVVLHRATNHPASFAAPGFVIGAIGLLVIGGCTRRLISPWSRQSKRLSPN